MARWTEDLRIKALTIAEATTLREASEQTGIPEGTIKRWRFENRTERGEPSRTNQIQRKTKELQSAATEKAIAEATDYITIKLKGLADGMYGLAEKAVGKINTAISDTDELPKGKKGESHDRDGAAWVRALVGVLAQSIDKAQLLSGKPTVRNEEVRRYEYDITQRIVSENPDLLDRIFGEDQQPSLEDRSGTSSRLGLGQLR